MKYGYVRVSTKEQNIDRQMTAMLKEKIDRKYIYIDKLSGKDFKRPMYKRMVKRMQKGDELVIKSIDRLGRNYDEIIEQWRYLIKEKEIDITVLDFPLLNTNSEIDNITGKFISGLALQILSYVAQVERENTKQRQMEGIEEAKKKGIQFGRPRKKRPSYFHEFYTLWKRKEITIREGAKQLGVSKTTFHNWLQEEYEEAHELNKYR
ncbi:recombinase family protein [Granulicatella sp. zg-ZJ]|uniref:recombinase family protein n=1 Tax=unclassified Granulicatella TaxID=2630493 RepID=UPI0013BF3750|nr:MULTISPECIES: recombinase family protein [unclassified Granulicatella]MBS4750729.1 recombinase family protein [Carnobacteriaceae bacterium zg-ZUI78]NEW62629.1 recombinase family protein [Granulicatella sp. zg-ZJ]NEW66477.1 recombinase family protein [Granulicatella sp. zg-84]QMI86020.1 recombinase family protein [Carnobacteriaceae bacterium zg-84]